MMAMVRDEHALIINYLKAQMAAEQRRDQAEDAATARAAEEARAAADAKLADALFASQTQTMAQQSAPAAAPALPKVASAHRKAPAVLAAAPHAPLAIAEADPPANDAQRRLSRLAKRASRTCCSPIRLSPRRSISRTTLSPRRGTSFRSLAECSLRSAIASAARCPGIANSTLRLESKPQGRVRRRMKWRMPSRPWVVHKQPVVPFCYRITVDCAVNDAFWQQASISGRRYLAGVHAHR